MEKLKRYDINFAIGPDGQVNVFRFEDENGGFVLSADVDAREEARKMTIAELRVQFEKDAPFSVAKNCDGEYVGVAGFVWSGYFESARRNGVLRDGE